MNQKSYDSLPDDLKKVIDDNSGLANTEITARLLNDDEADFRDELIKRGVKIAPLADEGPLEKAGTEILTQAVKKASGGGVDALKAVKAIEAASAKYGR